MDANTICTLSEHGKNRETCISICRYMFVHCMYCIHACLYMSHHCSSFYVHCTYLSVHGLSLFILLYVVHGSSCFILVHLFLLNTFPWGMPSVPAWTRLHQLKTMLWYRNQTFGTGRIHTGMYPLRMARSGGYLSCAFLLSAFVSSWSWLNAVKCCLFSKMGKCTGKVPTWPSHS